MADIIAELINTSKTIQIELGHFWIYGSKSVPQSIPDGLGVRIPGFHPGGPGSIPGLGDFFVSLCKIAYSNGSKITTPRKTAV